MPSGHDFRHRLDFHNCSSNLDGKYYKIIAKGSTNDIDKKVSVTCTRPSGGNGGQGGQQGNHCHYPNADECSNPNGSTDDNDKKGSVTHTPPSGGNGERGGQK
ncbi:hypothetical protein K470DRAFT_274308 [Piedraia hortae CBS 480.64]|uniref:Uncharacterized protein n=1 Tax=Piedraia hortae CBS 480.64 TaxID=1314780 RepID=A0A6A7C8J6_9PEZI|nr:hypothetical protein K470DRAFT_274308 [Piedraia hortae CBS 480.64]